MTYRCPVVLHKQTQTKETRTMETYRLALICFCPSVRCTCLELTITASCISNLLYFKILIYTYVYIYMHICIGIY